MTDSIHSYVVQRLNDSKAEWQAIAEATGLRRRTIGKIARREIANPGIDKIEPLWKYFRRLDSEERIAS